MIKALRHNLLNIPGKSSGKKVVVLESDDWGSIRMPSKKVYEVLQRDGHHPERDPYLKYDSLATEDDLQALFEVLRSVRDKNGRSAVITANAVVANPDFEKIESDGFNKYHYEPCTATLKDYPGCGNSFSLWKEGMDEGLFRPQYHGREHLNVFQWMNGLREGDELLRKAFGHRMLSISSVPGKMRYGYMEGLDYFSAAEREGKAEILEDGLQLFTALFGYKSKSFIANCYIWDEVAEKTLASQGVLLMQGISNQIVPELDGEGGHTHRYNRHFQGQRNRYGQRYIVRNVFFEPSLDPRADWVNDCLRRIKIAFRWGKPAVIGSHRLNYIGAIREDNRARNLQDLRKLLNEIVRRWPDVEFRSSDELMEIFGNGKQV